MNYILIDGSYFVYYRYYALCSWWKLSKQEGLPAVSNPIFKEKFDGTDERTDIIPASGFLRNSFLEFLCILNILLIDLIFFFDTI